MNKDIEVLKELRKYYLQDIIRPAEASNECVQALTSAIKAIEEVSILHKLGVKMEEEIAGLKKEVEDIKKEEHIEQCACERDFDMYKAKLTKAQKEVEALKAENKKLRRTLNWMERSEKSE